MSKFVYQPIFEHQDDSTEYRRLESASKYISVSEHDGREILNVDAEALRLLSAEGRRRAGVIARRVWDGRGICGRAGRDGSPRDRPHVRR